MKRLSGIVLLVVVMGLRFGEAQEGDLNIPGRIAYVGLNYDVHVIDVQTNADTLLTDDASVDERNVLIYQFPIWSTDGRLAYFQTYAVSENDFGMRVFVSPDGEQSGVERYTGELEGFTYAYWSPGNCEATESCRDLAVLLSRQGAPGFRVELVRDGVETPDNITAGTGSPFYMSWSADGGSMLWHRNSSVLEIYDAEKRAVSDPIIEQSGSFFTPSWSPVDDRLLFGERTGTSTDLIIRDGDDRTTIADEVDGFVSFAWSPTGEQIAFTSRREPLRVIDSVSGDETVATLDSGVLAFFWSPDGTKIAFLTLGTPGDSTTTQLGAAKPLDQQPTGIVWNVLDVASGDLRRFTPFVPARDMSYLLTYFDQFAPSHRVWSPDSRYLVYSEIRADGTSAINLLDTQGESSAPLFLAEGRFGVWSFE